jgi:hypothetical protein
MQRAAPPVHERLAFSVHQLPSGVPAAFLSLGQIISLVEKRLRWYGFIDWRIYDVLCDREQNVAVKIRGRDGIALTISLSRDCAAAEYGVHTSRALRRVQHPPRSRPPVEPDSPAIAGGHWSSARASRRGRAQSQAER